MPSVPRVYESERRRGEHDISCVRCGKQKAAQASSTYFRHPWTRVAPKPVRGVQVCPPTLPFFVINNNITAVSGGSLIRWQIHSKLTTRSRSAKRLSQHGRRSNTKRRWRILKNFKSRSVLRSSHAISSRVAHCQPDRRHEAHCPVHH